MADSSSFILPQDISRLTITSSTATVVHTGNSVAGFTQSSSFGHWILDSSASDHISGNKSLFFSLSTSGYLPAVTMANGSQAQSHGIGTDRNLGRTIGSGFESNGLYLLSSSSHVYSVPYSFLFPHQSLHSLPLRIFGSTCFVHELGPNRDKLSAKSHKCVFLGYTRTQKGYRCYSPSLHRSFVSADVTFFESVPFFGSTSVLDDSVDTQLPLLSVPIQYVPAPDSTPPLPAPDSTPPPPIVTSPYVPAPDPPLQVYHRRPHPPIPQDIDKVPMDSYLPSSTPAVSVLPFEIDLPIPLRKGTRNIRPPPRYSINMSYHHLSPSLFACLSSLSSVSVPKTTSEALSHPGWRQAMIDEMCALHGSGTWDLVPLLSGKSVVGCRWIFTVKVGPDGQVDHLKARLVAKGYTQVFGEDYGDTFSPVAKMASVRIFITMAVIRHWPLYQLDVKNAFLNGDDHQGITQLKQHLSHHFQTKDLGRLRYFLGIEVAQSKDGIVISQRKYAMDILEETTLLNAKPVDTPMDPNVKLMPNQGELFSDPESVVSQFLNSPREDHWNAVIRILKYIKNAPEMVNENYSSEGQDSSVNLPQSSSTKKKQGGWRAVRYILGNETFEKLASMSLIANLVVYLHTQYNIDTSVSAEVFNLWSGFTNFLPLVGAYVADAYVGKFNTLLVSSVASFLGMGFISLGAGIPSLRPPSCPTHSDCTQPNGTQLAVLYVGLGLFAVGSGGLRPCNIAFGADQFDTKTEKGRAQLESFCNWWYFLFTVALLVALTLVVYIQTNISWFLGFIIPTVCFAFSLTIFLLGHNTYVCLKPKGSIMCDLVKVIVAAYRKRHVDLKKDSGLLFYYPPPSSESEPRITKLAHTNRFSFFDKASVITNPSEIDNSGKSIDSWRLCSVQQVEELKSILNTLPVWLAGIVCFLSMGQANSFGILQALQTNKSIGPHFSVPPAWMGLVPMIALSLWIYLYEKIYVPWTKKTTKKGKRLSIEQRMLIGILLSIAGMAVSGLVEVRRRGDAMKHDSFESPTSIWWLVPQFALSGLVEAFAAIPMMELLTSYWPESMKTLGGAVFFLSLSIANYLSTILIRIIVVVTTRHGRTPWLGGNDLNKNRLEYFYYTILVLGVLNLLYFQFFARRYLYSEVLQRQSKNEAEEEENGSSIIAA
ncbi:uncharacterized protein LOC133294107 [Gastrolobium bilobum]|uniref:uncharacterized protein LOC133294107 n=1 Tax=Gastrolobium bilobum TaxID=150636 RepID=UPI002AB2F227|nr:uncharacterized protein LOC133294107 [Gastrolobium bilobum]